MSKIFNGTLPTGGDSTTENLNQWFAAGDIAYITVGAAMVFLMVPGLGFLYSGLARRKSALSMIWLCLFSSCVVMLQWFLCGYSLAFSSTATNGFIGNLDNGGFVNVLAAPSPGSPLIPEILYALYQCMFACVTVAIIAGACAERGRMVPFLVFSFFWMTFVYCPVANWVWGTGGWAFKWSVLDYAGGGPVEIGSGAGGLAYSFMLGKRKEKMLLNYRPHNVSLVTLGTILLWFGWLGFNGGSSFGANIRAVMASWTTNLTAAVAGMTWCVLDFRLEKKWSTVGFCSGCIAGLVAATPASGFIPPWAGIILGIVSGALCNYATKIKFLIKIDDSMDVFAEHGVGGIIGLLFNGLFAADYIIGLDGVNTGAGLIQGGWLNRNYAQLYKQFAYLCAVTAYVFVVTCLICFIIDKIPGLHLRASERAELIGMDEDQIGEFAYDYVEVRRDFLAWSPPSNDTCDTKEGPNMPTLIDHARTLDGASGSGESHENSEGSNERGEKTSDRDPSARPS